jgi:hypothetical protein
MYRRFKIQNPDKLRNCELCVVYVRTGILIGVTTTLENFFVRFYFYFKQCIIAFQRNWLVELFIRGILVYCITFALIIPEKSISDLAG